MLALFDIDGTLIDTERTSAEADVAAFQSIGWRVPWGPDYLITHLRGASSQAKFNHAASALHHSAPAPALYDAYRAKRNALITTKLESGDFDIFPGVRETLAALYTRVTMAAASNNPTMRSHIALKAKWLDQYFPDHMIFGPDSVGGKSKPDPAMLVAAMKAAHVNGRTTCFIGDSKIDVQTAQNAGILPIGFAPDPNTGTI